jgi:hypothetical protein
MHIDKLYQPYLRQIAASRRPQRGWRGGMQGSRHHVADLPHLARPQSP